ncbi:phosphoglycerate kinase [Xenorhabdus siamensis]|uniref:phosphoglycerate kinase n=1 Tax=Xenorhabdus siamensis TaxID=3136254 RepID=UPI0030F42350
MKKKSILYSAGINIEEGVLLHPRLDEEIYSLSELIHSNSNASISIINHQGDFYKGTSREITYIAELLSQKLKCNVNYISDCIGENAVRYSKNMKMGEIALFGNTRLYKEEQENDFNFAKELSKLGDELIIGGFCKLHRENSSNSSIKKFIPWEYSSGVRKEINKLNFLYNKIFSKKRTILILGGNKIEKVNFLLSHPKLSHVSKIVIGGIVLNSVLKSIGVEIGILKYFEIKIPDELLNKIYIPDTFIAERTNKSHVIRKLYNINSDEKIIDFIFDKKYFSDVFFSPEKYAFLAAGPLSIPNSKNSHICYHTLSKNSIDGLFMGGDTLIEVSTFSNVSSGGGASLQFFSTGYDQMNF